MTGQSLFPDDYPFIEPRSSMQRPPCCTELVAPDDLPARVWEFVHALGHSRVPFTVATLALGAQATHGDALTAARRAEEAGWIDRTHPEKWEIARSGIRWVGALQRRR